MPRITARPRRLWALTPIVSLVLSLVPAARIAAAPVQNDTTRIWTDTFTDATGFALGGSAAYDAAGQRITLTRQLPALTTVATTLPIAGQAIGVTVSGGRLYVAAGTGGLAIYSLANPGSPTLLGSVATTSAQEVAVAGTVAYVADGTAGVRVIDVTNPAAPTVATTLATTGDDTGLDVAGGRLYVAGGTAGLRLYDLSAPLAPTALGSTLTGPGAARDVVVSGTVAYVATSRIGGFGGGLFDVDVSNPAAPSIAGSLITPQDALEVAISGTTVYLANTTAGLATVDVSNPASPNSLAVRPTTGQAEGVAINGATAIVAMGTAGVQFFDVSTPANPIAQSAVDTPGTAHAVATLGTVTYVADEGDIAIINAPTPATSSLQTVAALAGGTVSDLTFAGGNLYAAEEAAGIVVYAVSGSGTLTQLGSYVTAGPAHAVAVSGTTAFVAIGAAGLVALDVSNPAAITPVSTLALSGAEDVVLASATRALVANGSSGLTVVNVSNPAAMTTVTTLGVGGTATAVIAPGGSAAYVATQAGTVAVVNVTNVDAPTLATTLATTGAAVNLSASGSLLAVAATDRALLYSLAAPLAPTLLATVTPAGTVDGVSISGSTLVVSTGAPHQAVYYDISTPASPVLLGSYGLVGPGLDVALAGGTLYVAASSAIQVAGASYQTPGSATSVTITPASVTRWNELVVGQTVPANTTITYDVLTPGNVVIPGYGGLTPVAGRIDISGLTGAAHPSIRVRANLATTDPTVAPALDDWTVTWDSACLTATSPLNGAVNVQRNSTVVLTFSEAVNLATLTYTSSFAGTFNVTANPAGTVVTLTPTTPFPASTLITFNLTFAETAAGNRITCFSVPNPFSFTTGLYLGPYVVTTTPADAATNVDRLADVVVTFSDPMDTASVVLTCSSGAPFTVVWSAGNTVATFSHAALWPASTAITCQVAGQDATGRALQPGPVPNPWTFTTGLFARPYVVSTTPADSAVNVDRGTDVVVTFSNAMNPATVTLTCSSGAPFTVVWSAGNTVATFSHAALWPASTAITCQVAGQDAVGRALNPGPVPNPWTFTTGLVARPYIVSTNPANGAVNVDRATPVVVTFSDPMALGSLTLTCSSGGPFVATLDVTGTIATFSHVALFAASTAVTCTAGGQDTTGRTVSTSLVPNPWTFNTGAVGRPYVVSTVPADGAVNVDRLADVVVTFSDPMALASLALTCSSGGPFVATLDVTGTIATFTHGTLFAGTSAVTCSVAGQDTTGRTVASSLVPNPWTFNTSAVARPYVVSTVPANGATNVDRLAQVVVTFSDPMNPATVTLACSAGAPFTVAWSAGNTIATFSHLALWPASTAITCTAAGQDATGRAVQTSLVPNPWTFTTGLVARPYIVSTVPASGATGVALNACVVVTFSDPMNPATLVYSSSFAGPYTVAWSAGNTVATFCHVANFPNNTQITFSIDSINDATGRPVLTSLVPNPWSFTTQVGPVGNGTEFTITAFVGGSTGSNHAGGVGSSTDVGGPNNDGGTGNGSNDDRNDDDSSDDDAPFDCRFSDVPEGHWAFPFVREICVRGITSGYPNGTYAPDRSVSRAEFLKFVLLMNHIEPDGTVTQVFSDVDASHSLYRYIQTGRRLGIITGYGDGTFRPNIPVTRAEAIKILFNGAGIQVGTDTTTSFVDVQASDWFATFVSFAERNQIVDGGNSRIFSPYANLTRAEAAKIITKALKLTVGR